jgi:hypothetical protein
MRQKCCLTILVLALAGEIYAQNRAADFQISKINRDLITAPQYAYTGAEQKRETRDRWLRVEAQFSTVPAFTDELTFKYYILLGDKVLTGEVTHVNILNGREHYSAMYVPPHALAFIMQNRPVNTTSVGNIGVQLLQKGEVKDELSLNRARPQWYAALPAVSGMVLNKNETPFAPLFSDYYEQIKPLGH